MANQERIAEWNISKLAFAKITKVNGVITAFGTPVMHPGAISLNVSPGNNTDNVLSADGGRYYGGNGSKTKTGELNVARFNDWFRENVLGETNYDGMMVEGDGESSEVAMLWEVDDDQGGNRNVWFDCTASDITKNFSTTTYDGTVNYATETSTITSVMAELPNGVKARKATIPKGDPRYDDFFSAVVLPGNLPDTTLSALTIGSLTLTPTFDKDTTTYTASTTNESDTITATATASGATVAIKNGTTTVESGSAATWSAGTNTVTVTVTNGGVTKTYTVTVTKS